MSWDGTGTASEPAPGRRVVYCLLPADLASKLHDLLRSHFRDEPGVEVVVEARQGERRSGTERRTRRAESPAAGERRRVRSLSGRRIADRRAVHVAAAAPPELPRRARRYAERISFVERVEPSAQQAEDEDTARLVMRFQAGDREAFAPLYARYFDRVYAYLRVAFKDSHEAEDMTQQLFTQVFEKLDGYERRAQPFRAWLFTVVRNLAVRQLERQGRIDVVDPAALNDRRAREDNGEPVPELLDWITDRDLLVLVERLPLAQRQVLLLRFGLGLTSGEAADVLGRKPSDVRMLGSRALRTLRARLGAIQGLGEASVPERRRERSCRRPVRRADVMRARRYALR